MNIDSININNPGLGSTQFQGTDQVRQNGQTQNTGSGGGNDSVQLSSASQEIDKYAALAGQSREERIEQLRQQVQAGTYNVSGEAIASKMIGLNS